MSKFQDRMIECQDCHKKFLFSVGEQEFFVDKGYEHDPKRCRDCRRKRQSDREERQMKRDERGQPRPPRSPE